MTAQITCDEELIRRLPLPLAQLYRQAANAKTALDRHQSAYFLWEASLKLMSAAAVVTYAEQGAHDPSLVEPLSNLARPALGHWWQFIRLLAPILADRNDEGYGHVRDLVLGRTRDDLPRAAGLDAALREALQQGSGARTTVRISELFDRLVRYRNRELGHGAAGQRADEFYHRIGAALFAGVPELLSRIDVLAGRRLIAIVEVKRLSSGNWIVDRFELHGETARRLDPLEMPAADSARLPHPQHVYLQTPGSANLAPSLTALHPLAIYHADEDQVLLLNSRRGRQRSEYLSYSSGQVLERDDLGAEQRELMRQVLDVDVSDQQIVEWGTRSQAEEGAAVDEGMSSARTLGEFELLSTLGRGGMAVVYRAWQPSLGRQVALKCLTHSGDKAEARFAGEIRALGKVVHPHLVKVFTSGAEGDQWFYAMELLEGATLAAVCESLEQSAPRVAEMNLETWHKALSTVCEQTRRAEKPFGGSEARQLLPLSTEPQPIPEVARGSYVRQIVELIQQVAVATHALHEAGIIHRDIKPGNIMVSADGSQAVLMDLGLAQFADELDRRLTRTRQFVGTLRYASPEQVRAIARLDGRTDVYSLGATLWELLTLRPIFGADEHMPTPQIMERIQYEEPEPIRKYHSTLATDLEAIVTKCLEKDPRRRYATALELADDLGHWLRDEPVRAKQPTILYRSRKFVHRHRKRIMAIAALLVVQLSVIVAVLWLPPKTEPGGSRTPEAALERLALLEKSAEQYAADGNLDKAESLYREALKLHQEQFGDEDPRTIDSLLRLAALYTSRGEYKTAKPLYELALKTRRRMFGAEHVDAAAVAQKLATVLRSMGEESAARKLLRESGFVSYRALLIGCTYQGQLKGPENDCALMRKLLIDRFRFDPSDIQVLIEEEATREKIARHISNLADVAETGDHFVIFLAGRGAQLPVDGRASAEGSKESAFFPSDFKMTRRAQSSNAIYDHEFSDWIEPIIKKNASVWLINDACGGGVATACAEQSDARLVVFNAAAVGDVTVELPLPLGIADAKVHGLFSYTLCQVITQSASPISYSGLLHRIVQQYSSQARIARPWITGHDTHRVIFGANRWAPKAPVIVVPHPREGFMLNAGALQGLASGTILAVRTDEQQKKDKTIGHVRVVEVFSDSATAQPCAYAGMPAIRDISVGRCEPVYIDCATQKLKIGVDPNDHLTGALSDDFENRRSQLEEAIKPLIADMTPLIELVSVGEESDWVIRHESVDSDAIYVVPYSNATNARGIAISAEAFEFEPEFGPIPAAKIKETLPLLLAKIARARRLLQLTEKVTAERFRTGAGLDVSVELVRLTRRKQEPFMRKIEDHIGVRLGDLSSLVDETVAFRITNLSPLETDVTLLLLNGLQFELQPWISNPNILQSNHLAPGESFTTNRYKLTNEDLGPRHLIVVAEATKRRAVEARNEGQSGFYFLAEPSSWDTTSTTIPHNIQQSLNTHFGQLLANAFYGQEGVTGVDIETLKTYSLSSLTWNVGTDSDVAVKLWQVNRRLAWRPNDPKLLLSRAQIYFADNSNATIADASRVIEFSPTESDAYYYRGHAYASVGQWEEAIRDLSKYIDRKGATSTDVTNRQINLMRRAWCFAQLERWDEAIADCDRVNDLGSTDAGWLGRHLVFAARGDWQKAEAEYRRAAECAKHVALPWQETGSIASTFLFKDLHALIASGKEDWWLWRSLAFTTCVLSYSSADAVEQCTKAIERNPNDAATWHLRAVAHILNEQFDAAEADLLKASELAADDWTIWARLGWLRTQLKRFEESIDSYSRALALLPNDAALLNQRGVAYEAMGKLSEAAADLEKAVALNPKTATILENHGRVQARLRHWKQAIDAYLRLDELEPANPLHRRDAALAALADNDANTYRDGVSELLKRFDGSDVAEVVNIIARLLVLKPNSLLQIADDDPDGFIKLAHFPVASYPENRKYLEVFGAAQYRSEQFESAVETLQQAAEGQEGGGSAFLHIFLAMSHQRLGHTEEARKWWPPDDPGEISSWQDEVILRILRAEGEALIGLGR